ncbi:MAG: type II methionyl aminopeptidase [Candidatus Asgardarchaeia archaeon]
MTKDDESLEKILKAGEIAKKAMEYGLSLIKPGVLIYEVCEKIEQKIIKEGGFPAFPVNISINSVAAHYTSPIGDNKRFLKGMLVKLDLGVHVDGYIADTARSIVVGGSMNEIQRRLIEAAESALLAAEKKIKAGTRISEIGQVIEDTIKSKGFIPVYDLSGHSIQRYQIHGGLSIPNHGGSSIFSPKLKDGMLIAIEPFVTTGKSGRIKEDTHAYIFSVRSSKYNGPEKDLVDKLYKNFNLLPFASRWIKWMKKRVVEAKLNYLARIGAIYRYPVLIDANGGIVSQAENTYYVTKDGFIKTTNEPFTIIRK